MVNRALMMLVNAAVLAFSIVVGGCGDSVVDPGPTTSPSYHVAYMLPYGYGYHLARMDERGLVSSTIASSSGTLYNGSHEFSPTGGRIAYFSDEILKLYDIKSGRTTTVDLQYYGFQAHNARVPSWSPKGERFIVMSEDGYRYSIIDSNGTVRSIRDVPEGARASVCFWSPTSDLIAIDTPFEIIIMTATGQVVKRIDESGQLLRWTLDGANIAVLKSAGTSMVSCYSINIESGAKRLLFTMPRPDGSAAYPSHSTNYAVFASDGRIDRYDLETGEKTTTQVNGFVWYAELRGDGNRYVYYTGSPTSARDGNIHMVNVDGTGDVLLKSGAVFPRWSPTKW